MRIHDVGCFLGASRFGQVSEETIMAEGNSKLEESKWLERESSVKQMLQEGHREHGRPLFIVQRLTMVWVV